MNQTLRPFRTVVGDLEVKLQHIVIPHDPHDDGNWILTITPSAATRERPSVEIPLNDRGYVQGLPSQRNPEGGGSIKLSEVRDRYYTQIRDSLPDELRILFDEMRVEREYSVLPIPPINLNP